MTYITYQHNYLFIAQSFWSENSTELKLMFSNIYICNIEYYIQISLS